MTRYEPQSGILGAPPPLARSLPDRSHRDPRRLPDGAEHGLEFIAFAGTLDTFERILRRMLGLDGGVVDAVFTFSRPVTGGYYWFLPLRSGKLDLSALGIEG